MRLPRKSAQSAIRSDGFSRGKKEERKLLEGILELFWRNEVTKNLLFGAFSVSTQQQLLYFFLGQPFGHARLPAPASARGSSRSRGSRTRGRRTGQAPFLDFFLFIRRRKSGNTPRECFFPDVTALPNKKKKTQVHPSITFWKNLPTGKTKSNCSLIHPRWGKLSRDTTPTVR